MKNNNLRRELMFLYNAKSMTGIYFSTFVLFYLVLSALSNGISNSVLGFMTAFQMLVCSALIGFSQEILIPKDKISLKRTMVWGTLMFIITIGFCEFFGWFSQVKIWCKILFYLAVLISVLVVWLALEIKANVDTKELNDALKKFQSK